MQDEPNGSGPTAAVSRSASETPTTPLKGLGGPPPGPGTTVLRYIVVETVGEGGMGVVLRAYDPKLQREVALKLVRPGTVSPQAEARMLREARAMAQLSHPHVVNVYDVEQDADIGVVVAMELVRGVTMRQWLREDRTWREVVQHFVAAGRGLAAAHDAGMLHRDFKPSNVLIGDDGRARVTDFGLARAADSESVDLVGSGAHLAGDGLDIGIASSVTEVGAVMGTRAYMAPEQLVGETLTAAADQYAFCASLWQGLCGELPFAKPVSDVDNKGAPKWKGPAAVPTRIVSAIRIGLALQPADRWPTVAALLAELTAASAPSRRSVWVASGVVVVGLGMLTYSAVARTNDERCTGADALLAQAWGPTQREAAETAMLATGRPFVAGVWTRTRATLDDYGERWVAAHTEACRATSVRGERSTDAMDLAMACLDGARLDLSTVGALLADANAELVEHAHDVVNGLPPLARCEDIAGLRAETPAPAEDEATRVSATQEILAEVTPLLAAGRIDAAQKALEQAEALANAPPQLRYVPTSTRLTMARGVLAMRRGKHAEAEQAFRDTLAQALRSGQWEQAARAASWLVYEIGSAQARPSEVTGYIDLARALGEKVADPRFAAATHTRIGGVLGALGRSAEAEEELRLGVAIAIEGLGAHDATVANARHNLGVELQRQGRVKEALVEHRRAANELAAAVGPGHPDAAEFRTAVAGIVANSGGLEEAEREFRAIVDATRDSLGDDHPSVGRARIHLAQILMARDRLDEAEAEFRTGLLALRANLESGHPWLVQAQTGLAGLLGRRGLHVEAEAQIREVLDAVVARDPNASTVATTRVELATQLAAQGRHEEAEAEYRQVLAAQRQSLGDKHWRVGMAHANVGYALKSRGELDAAEHELRAGEAILAAAMPADDAMLAVARLTLADVLLSQGDTVAALPLAERVWAAFDRDDAPPRERVAAAFVLGKALWAQGEDRARARTLVERAHAWCSDAKLAAPERIAELTKWLAEHPPP